MATVDNPSGAHTDTLVTDNEDGTYSVSYTPFEEGIHTLSVKFGGDHIPGSPFKVRVQFTSCSFKITYRFATVNSSAQCDTMSALCKNVSLTLRFSVLEIVAQRD